MPNLRARPSRGGREAFAARLSIVGAVLIFAVSSVVGVTCDSIALLLDAGTGFIILCMTLFARVAIRKVGSPPDRLFHFGYGKYEPLAAATQNIGIVSTCVLGAVVAVQDIIHPEDIVRYDLPAASSLACGMIALALGGYLRGVAGRDGSVILRASATQWFVDAGLSFAMCAGFMLGIAAVRFGCRGAAPYIDPAMAIVLALLFMRLPLRELGGELRELLDGAPEQEICDRIEGVAKRYGARACGVHRVRARRAGRRTFLEVGFVVREDLTAAEAAALAEEFERELIGAVPGCEATVYFKPARRPPVAPRRVTGLS